MIGTPVRSAAETKPPRPNRCSLYRSANGLPMPLKPSGHTPTSSPSASSRSASALQASVLPCLRPSWPTHRQPEHQVRAEHAQVPVRGVVVVHRDRGHQRVERDGAGVVGHDQRAALVGDVLHTDGLDAEPRAGTAAAAAGSTTFSVSSASKPNSSTS